MHPNPIFRSEDRALLERIIAQAGFGMVFLTTPDGPRVAHTALLSDGAGRLRFHLARGNALTRHLDGATALVVVNGPHAYVSPRWYEDRATVPTWDYAAIEMEGPVRQVDDAELDAMLHELIATNEGALEGEPWRAQETPPEMWGKLVRAIAGFELEVREWRPTLKLSQKKSPAERERIASEHEASGAHALAALMREVAP
jgi:transcriptional regulator